MQFGPLKVGRPVVGLALGSGAARGWAHVGVFRALEAAGIEVDIVTGTSAGAIVGAYIAAGEVQNLEELGAKQSALGTFGMLDFAWKEAGLISGKKMIDAHRAALTVRDFSQLKIPFGVVATNLTRMEEVHITSGAIFPALRASVAVPGFMSPAEAPGDIQLVDGGMLNPVPVSLARRLGADVVIAVDLDARFHPESQRCETTTQVMNRSIEVMMRRIRLMNREFFPADITLEPEMKNYGFLDYHRVTEAARIGYDTAMDCRYDIQKLLDQPLAYFREKYILNTRSVEQFFKKLSHRTLALRGDKPSNVTTERA